MGKKWWLCLGLFLGFIGQWVIQPSREVEAMVVTVHIDDESIYMGGPIEVESLYRAIQISNDIIEIYQETAPEDIRHLGHLEALYLDSIIHIKTHFLTKVSSCNRLTTVEQETIQESVRTLTRIFQQMEPALYDLRTTLDETQAREDHGVLGCWHTVLLYYYLKEEFELALLDLCE